MATVHSIRPRVPGAAVLAQCDRAVATLYRSRARERLKKARQVPAYARQAVIDEALLWRSFANVWARKARGVRS